MHRRLVVAHLHVIVLVSTLVLASGCGAHQRPTQVEREYAVDASRSPARTFGKQALSARPVMENVEVSAPRRTLSKPAAPVQSLQSNAHTTCSWLLAATGERFASKSAALAFADENALTDRRVGEICSPSRQPHAWFAAARGVCVLGSRTLDSSCAPLDENDVPGP